MATSFVHQSNCGGLESSPEKTRDSSLHSIDIAERKSNPTAAPPATTTTTTNENNSTHYPSGAKLALMVFALCLSVFCNALDNTIIATAIPHITDEFNSLQDIGWYGSAYLLTTCGFQLFFGKLYAHFNIKFVYLTALLIFEIGSAVCGAAPTSTAFIIGRAVAGFGAAGIFTGVLLIIAHSTPVHKRPVYTGIAGAMYGLASVVAPLIGGALTDRVTWRWCFYINLPIGAFTAVVVVLYLSAKLNEDQVQEKHSSSFLRTFLDLDPMGNILFVVSIICLLIALQWGGTTYAWNDGRMIALLAVFSLTLIGFIGLQIWLGDAATIPPRIMTQRTILFASIFGFLLGSAFFTLMYFLPVWFQAIKGENALHSGIDTIPLILTMTIGIILSGGLTTKFGYYMPFVIASPVLTSLGTGLMTTFLPDTSIGKWIGYQILFGFGCGLAFQVPQIAAQTALPLSQVAQGVSITFFAETFGGAIFVSAGNNILNTGLTRRLLALDIPALSVQQIVNTGATELASFVPAQYLASTISAYNDVLRNVFQVALIVSCLSVLGAIGMEWRSVHDPVNKSQLLQQQQATEPGLAPSATAADLDPATAIAEAEIMMARVGEKA